MPRKVNRKNTKYKYGDIYRHNGDEFYKVNDVRDLEYNNKPFREYIHDLEKLNNSYGYLETLLAEHKSMIKDFLYNVTNIEYDEELHTLIFLLHNLLVINEYKSYNVIELDDDGYVSNIQPINGVISEEETYPSDVLNGYYKIENNKIVKDEERYNQLYNQL